MEREPPGDRDASKGATGRRPTCRIVECRVPTHPEPLRGGIFPAAWPPLFPAYMVRTDDAARTLNPRHGGFPRAMARYRVEFDIRHCEGNFNCIGAAPDLFVTLTGGLKADLIGHEMHARGFQTLDIEADSLEAAIEAARVCPPQVIRVVDLDTGDILEGPEELPVEQAAEEGPTPIGAPSTDPDLPAKR